MFTCPNCKTEAYKLISTGHGIMCPSCYTEKTSNSPTYLHTKAGLSRESKNITEAQKRHILKRDLSSDGKSVVYRDNPNRVWSW